MRGTSNVDPYWNSSIPRSYDELKAFATSSDVDERQMVAAMYDLPEDLVAILAVDDVLEVASAAAGQWTATAEILAAAAAKHPELTAQISLHDNAPAHLLRLKPIAYADKAQLDRFYDSVDADADARTKMSEVAREFDFSHNISESVEQVWTRLTGRNA